MKYIKVKEDIIYTPIMQHKKNELTITSLGAIHIGPPRYYKKLQTELNKLPFGFFEGIKPLTEEENVQPEKRQYLNVMQNLKEAYQKIADCLGMITQHGSQQGLTYPNSWQNPDMTLEEFINAAPNRILKKISNLRDRIDKFENYHKTNPKESAAMIKGAARYFLNSSLLSKTILGSIYGPMYRKVILDERNQKLFEAMEPELGQPKVEKLGIIYGAAHLKGIDKFLRREGFEREGEFWVPAWDLQSDISFWQAVKTMAKDKAERDMERKKQ